MSTDIKSLVSALKWYLDSHHDETVKQHEHYQHVKSIYHSLYQSNSRSIQAVNLSQDAVQSCVQSLDWLISEIRSNLDDHHDERLTEYLEQIAHLDHIKQILHESSAVSTRARSKL